MKTNFHTHTSRCNHACGEDADYVTSAIQGGFSMLGFSDHAPWPFVGGFCSPIRMAVEELDGYVASIRQLRAMYKDRIDIRVGLECEYFPPYIDWLCEQRERLALDYLLFGHHFPYKESKSPYFGHFTRTPADLQLYVDSAIEGLESGLFGCMAHPDLFMRSYRSFDTHCERVSRELCRAAARLDVVLECNYSLSFCRPFWVIAAEEKCRVIVGADAHEPAVLKSTEVHCETTDRLLQLGIVPVFNLS